MEKDEVAVVLTPHDRERAAKISPLPPPEEVFVDWLMSVPPHACLEDEARRQVELIDSRPTLHPDVRCLRALLVAVAGERVAEPCAPQSLKHVSRTGEPVSGRRLAKQKTEAQGANLKVRAAL